MKDMTLLLNYPCCLLKSRYPPATYGRTCVGSNVAQAHLCVQLRFCNDSFISCKLLPIKDEKETEENEEIIAMLEQYGYVRVEPSFYLFQ